jgi:hypothetical protein
MKNTETNRLRKNSKTVLRIGKWLVKPELVDFNEPTREVMIIAGTLIGAFSGTATYGMSGAFMAFDEATAYLSNFISGSNDASSFTPEFVQSVVDHPVETILMTTAIGMGVGSYIALAGRSIPPRDPDVWNYDVWDLPKNDPNKK